MITIYGHGSSWQPSGRKGSSHCFMNTATYLSTYIYIYIYITYYIVWCYIISYYNCSTDSNISRIDRPLSAGGSATVTGVWYRCLWSNTPFMRALALQLSSRHFFPATDLVFFVVILPRVFSSGGVLFSQTPVEGAPKNKFFLGLRFQQEGSQHAPTPSFI